MKNNALFVGNFSKKLAFGFVFLLFFGNLAAQNLDSLARAMAQARQSYDEKNYYKQDSLAEKPLGLIYKLATPARFVCSDVALNAYIISEKNEILSFGPQGETLGRYTNDKLGAAGSIDCSNPSAILVWYPDFHTVVWLDASLTELGRLDLRKFDLSNANILAAGSDQTLWVYDDVNFQLKNIDKMGKTRYSSQNLTQILGKTPKPNGIQEYEQSVFMGDESTGFYVFDKFAQYQKTIVAATVRGFQVTDNKLRYFDEGLIKEIFTKNTTFKRAVPPPPQVKKDDTVYIQKRRIYVLRPDGFEAWFLGMQ